MIYTGAKIKIEILINMGEFNFLDKFCLEHPLFGSFDYSSLNWNYENSSCVRCVQKFLDGEQNELLHLLPFTKHK